MLKKRNDGVISPADLWEFVEWVASKVCDNEFENEADVFAEQACRRLWRLGIIEKGSEEWVYRRKEVRQ